MSDPAKAAAQAVFDRMQFAIEEGCDPDEVLGLVIPALIAVAIDRQGKAYVLRELRKQIRALERYKEPS